MDGYGTGRGFTRVAYEIKINNFGINLGEGRFHFRPLKDIFYSGFSIYPKDKRGGWTSNWLTDQTWRA